MRHLRFWKDYPCGYAPRVLRRSLWSAGEDVLFVGSKDGSVTILDLQAEAPKTLQSSGAAAGGVRVLQELGPDWLLIGRNDGQVDVVEWRRPDTASVPMTIGSLRRHENRSRSEESVRYATWLDDVELLRRDWRGGRLLLSYRQAGTWVLSIRAPADGGRPGLPELREAFKNAKPFTKSAGDLGGLRLAARIRSSSAVLEPSYLLIDRRGRLWRWDRQAEPPSLLFQGSWPPEESSPARVNDVTYVGPPRGRFKDIQGLVLTTDLGVFAIDLRAQSWQDRAPRPLRLALPGAGSVGMAVTYVERGDRAFLWMATRDGACHLFENGPLAEDAAEWALGFRKSGQTQAEAQVLVALGWGEDKGDAIWLAQACRDDQVRIYRDDPERVDEADVARILRTEETALQTLQRIVGERKAAVDGEWPAYALLGEAFEIFAETDRSRFFEFLSSPDTTLATAMLQELGSESRRAAVELWTLCLVGLVNRQPQPREEWYLGILRFLRGLAPSEDDLELNRATEWAIRFAHKWGLYGEVNQIRQNLVAPLEVLRPKKGTPLDESADAGPALDELTYSVLLFRRSHSLVAEDRSRRRQGTSAWALSTLPVDSGTLVAVSWYRRGVYLGLLEAPGQGAQAPELVPFKLPSELEPADPPDDSQYGYGRTVLLLSGKLVPGADPREVFLLTAIRRQEETNPHEELRLWPVRLIDREVRDSPVRLDPGCSQVLSDESVYRLAVLAEGLIAAGLKGDRGTATVALFGVSAKGPLRLCSDLHRLAPSTSRIRSEGAPRNRVWSLACVERESGAGGDRAGNGEKPTFLVGCESGEIWMVMASRQAGEVKWSLESHRVARLAAPVTALACRTLPGGLLRIFAGARDGTVICFQQEQPGGKVFASLWATAEQAPISTIQWHEYAHEHEREEAFGIVVAIARNGACVAMDDRDRMDVPEEDTGRPRRSPFPGIRRVHTAIQMPCFAAATFTPGKAKLKNPDDAWCFLAAASDDGMMAVHSLHLPRHTVSRKEYFKGLVKSLWEVVLVHGRPERVRIVEALYRSAPLLMLIPVHWMLDPDCEDDGGGGNRGDKLMEMDPWWLPRSLRPLGALRRAWVGEQNAKGVKDELLSLLRAAREQGDADLFKELCSVALKRVNRELFRAAREDQPEKDNPETLRDLYLKVIEAIEASLPFWTGAPEEMSVRSVVGKNLVDGDTAWRVNQRVVAAKKANDEKSAWHGILATRIDGVRQLVFKGDILVSLEALRAANHSLLRLCRRLQEARHPRRNGSAELTAIPREVFEPYFRQLAFGAAQQLQPNPRLSDVLFHEYARTFALCLCACPEGVVRMLNRLTDARLIVDPLSPYDLSARIESQLKVLDSTFGVSTLDLVHTLLKGNLLRPNLDDLNEREKFYQPTPEDLRWAAVPLASIRGDLEDLDLAYEPVRRLRELAHGLSTDARGLDLLCRVGERGMPQLLKAVAGMAGTAVGELYQHSLTFWLEALGDLVERVGLEEELSGDKIRPEVVLRSRPLAEWAEHWNTQLDRKYLASEIFQPQYPLFKSLLQRVKRAAEGFAVGAAVQKNLVVGLLGHHLLEDLDLHVFELREIARNLDPRGLDPDSYAEAPETHGGAGVPRQAKSSEFAAQLVHRARRAKSLPKNLRALAKVLEPASPEALGAVRPEVRSGSLWSIIDAVTDRQWSTPGDEPEIGAEALELLTLVVQELHQNHQDHSGLAPFEQPRVTWDGGSKSNDNGFVLEFPFRVTHERLKRLKEMQGLGLQQPMQRATEYDVASTGAGLYVSCLAAAIGGWRLRPCDLSGDLSDQGVGCLPFRLETSERLSLRGGRGEQGGVPAGDDNVEGWRHIVMIDDKPEVALYLWREVCGVTGFGSASVTEDQAREWFLRDQAPRPIRSPTGDTEIWWIAAKEGCRAALERLREKIGNEGRRLFLVDVRGPVGASGYDLDEVLAYLRSWNDSSIRLISSYRPGIYQDGRRIEPKTPETFGRLKARKPAGSAAREPAVAATPQALHILVTGAGFERESEPWGLRLGIPSTWALLKDWIRDFYREEVPENLVGPGFPMPKVLWDAVPAERRGVLDLDTFWDELLRVERAGAAASLREPDPLQAAVREHDLRDAFRRQFLRYDWGQLNQALAAADLGWAAWLSTNYTRFANRAIDWEQVAAAGGASRRPWRTVETRTEAERLEREILHQRDAEQLCDTRFLFKLHGDIGHVLTMALAGEDKTFLSRLQSFAPLYLAARSYLLARSRSSEVSQPWIWHIVGHGLRDQLLVELIEGVFQAGSRRHRFVVVDPAAKDPVEDPAEEPAEDHPADRLSERLGRIAEAPNVQHCRLTAEEYLARLERAGLDGFESVIEPPSRRR